MSCKKKLKEIRKLLLDNNDITQGELGGKLMLDKKNILNSLMNLCDEELYQFLNPFDRKKVEINSNNIAKIKYFLISSYKVLADDNLNVKNPQVVNTALRLIEEIVYSYTKEKEDYVNNIDYINVIDNLVFNINSIGIFKIVYNREKNGLKDYFRDTENFVILLEKFFDKIRENNDEFYLINVVKILAFIANDNTTAKNDLHGIINTYHSKLKSKKITNGDKKGFKKYFSILKKAVNNQTVNSKEILSTLNLNYGIAKDFDIETLNEVRKLSNPLLNDYFDFTNKEIITIDGTANGCLEDGLSLEQMPNGNHLLGVYVIDPGAYIPADSSLIKEAFNRTQSVYVKGNVIPMFPDPITYDLCSLLEGENRYVLAHFYEFSDSFDFIKSYSKKGIVNVKGNHAFDEIDNFENQAINISIEQLFALKESLKSEYSGIRNGFERNNFSSTEFSPISFGDELINYIKVFVNHQLTCRYLQTNQPFLYCVDKGFNESINELQKSNPNLDLNKEIKKSKTYYSIENIGHRGLNLDCYARVSTPIRNYAAYKNQQLFKETFLNNKKYSDFELKILEKELKKVVNHMNQKLDVINDYAEENNYHFQKVKQLKLK